MAPSNASFFMLRPHVFHLEPPRRLVLYVTSHKNSGEHVAHQVNSDRNKSGLKRSEQ